MRGGCRELDSEYGGEGSQAGTPHDPDTSRNTPLNTPAILPGIAMYHCALDYSLA